MRGDLGVEAIAVDPGQPLPGVPACGRGLACPWIDFCPVLSARWGLRDRCRAARVLGPCLLFSYPYRPDILGRFVVADPDAGAHARQPSISFELFVVPKNSNALPALRLGHDDHGADRRLRQAAAAPNGFNLPTSVGHACAVAQTELDVAGGLVDLDPIEVRT